MPPELAVLIAAAAPLHSGARVEAGRHPGVIGTLYHLVARGKSDRYREVLSEAAQHLVDVHAVITGPAPPYAFADLNDAG